MPESRNPELKPCPFCGSPAIGFDDEADYCRCSNTSCPMNIGMKLSYWNHRHPTPEEIRLREALEEVCFHLNTISGHAHYQRFPDIDSTQMIDAAVQKCHKAIREALQPTPEQTNEGDDGIEEGGAFDQWNAKDKAEGAKLHGADYTIWSNTRPLRAWQAALSHAKKDG